MAPAPGEIEVWVLPASRARAGVGALAGSREIQRDADGKPHLVGGPYFNLSHSGDLALIAVCPDAPVGVDLEALRGLRNPAGLARRMCSERELAWLEQDRGADEVAAATPGVDAVTVPGVDAGEIRLLRLWVRKEAVAKAQGGGLATALSGIDVLDPLVTAVGRRWFVVDLPAPGPGYLAALAWAAEDAPAEAPEAELIRRSAERSGGQAVDRR